MLSFLHKQRINLVYVVTHRLADVDAYCASYGTGRLLKAIGKNMIVKFVFPEGLNTIARKVSKSFPISIENNADFARADLIIIVDTNNPLLLSKSRQGIVQSKAEKILIDHHPLGKNVKKIANVLFVNTKASSASEIVYDLYRSNQINISKRVAQILLLGIMADSQHFFLASGETITAVSELYKIGASIASAKKILTRERDRSERLARLKAASRVTLYSVNEFLIAFARIGSFHASVAKSLIDLGADVGIAVGGTGNRSRASLRATPNFYRLSNLHLGIDVTSKLSESGGGHAVAASLSREDIDENTLGGLLLDKVQEKMGKLNLVK